MFIFFFGFGIAHVICLCRSLKLEAAFVIFENICAAAVLICTAVQFYKNVFLKKRKIELDPWTRPGPARFKRAGLGPVPKLEISLPGPARPVTVYNG